MTRHHAPRSLGVLALALSWGMLSVLGLSGDVSSAGSPHSSPAGIVADPRAPTPAPQRLTDPRATGQPAGAPVRIDIPVIDVTADVTNLGLNRNGTVEVPEDPDEAGWYRKGPRPGEPGSAVILGHVDSTVGPAVFFRLKNLDPGDQIAVGRADGTVAHFGVTRVAHYANEDFPRQIVYAKTPDRPALNLVTCGGEYDPDNGGYQSNVVVYTTFLWASDKGSTLG